MRHSSYSDSAKGPTMVGLEAKVFKTEVLRWLENAILTLVLENTVNTSNTFFQQLRKQFGGATPRTVSVSTSLIA